MISAYFDEKGLVRQQLDSFDEFINNTMQEVRRRSRGSISLNQTPRSAWSGARAQDERALPLPHCSIAAETINSSSGGRARLCPHVTHPPSCLPTRSPTHAYPRQIIQLVDESITTVTSTSTSITATTSTTVATAAVNAILHLAACG